MLHPLTPHILYLPHDDRYDRPILAAIIGEERVLMVDAGASPRHAALFLDGLRQAVGRRPDLVVLTHRHWDHTFGLTGLAAPAIGHRNIRANLGRLQGLSWEDEALDARVAAGEESPFCARYLKEEYGAARDIRVVLPAILLGGPVEVDLGGVTCTVQPLESDHTDDALVVFAREDGALFLGDAVYSGTSACGHYYTAAKVTAMARTLQGFAARWYVSSHEPPWSGEEFRSVLDRLTTLARAVAGGVRDRDGLWRALEQRLGRALTDEEREEAEPFLNGAALDGGAR